MWSTFCGLDLQLVARLPSGLKLRWSGSEDTYSRGCGRSAGARGAMRREGLGRGWEILVCSYQTRVQCTCPKFAMQK